MLMRSGSTIAVCTVTVALYFGVLVPPAQAGEPTAVVHDHSAPEPVASAELTLDDFLDRLMVAESGGDDQARNLRSTALGAYQFIAPTFLRVVRQHLADETAKLSPSGILQLRTDREFARRAAAAYTKDNAYHLASRGLPTSFVNLRLAYLVGPSGAVKVLRADPNMQVNSVLSASALKANPFMARMTVADLIAKCARDLSVDAQTLGGLSVEAEAKTKTPTPQIAVKCSLARPSCHRWLSLAKRRLKRHRPRSSAAIRKSFRGRFVDRGDRGENFAFFSMS
jgi:hypothetical protein